MGVGGGARIGDVGVGVNSARWSSGEGGDGDIIDGRGMLGDGVAERNRVISCWVELVGILRVIVFGESVGGGRINETE